MPCCGGPVASGPIAVIDDDEAARLAIIDLLAAHGLEAKGFAGGRAFLAAGLGVAWRCLIVDVRMPGLDGLELLRRIGAGGVPLILVTAWPDAVSRAHGLALGALGYLAKPLAPDALLALLRQIA